MQSDLGPVIGGIAPMKPIEKPYRFDDACILQRAAGYVLGLVIVFVLTAVIALVSVIAALAQEHHEHHHVFYQNWTNRDGTGCCNDRDCGELAAENERETSGVLEVRIEGQWCPVLPRHYLKSGNVPDASVSHVCVEPKTSVGVRGPCERLLCYQPQPRS